eukprot:943990-Rhodomonas_salina.2
MLCLAPRCPILPSQLSCYAMPRAILMMMMMMMMVLMMMMLPCYDSKRAPGRYCYAARHYIAVLSCYNCATPCPVLTYTVTPLGRAGGKKRRRRREVESIERKRRGQGPGLKRFLLRTYMCYVLAMPCPDCAVHSLCPCLVPTRISPMPMFGTDMCRRYANVTYRGAYGLRIR